MTLFTVTVTGEDALGRAVTGSASALLLPGGSRPSPPAPPPSPITETIEVKVDASRLLAFADLVERHAAAIKADLERFMAGEDRDEGSRMLWPASPCAVSASSLSASASATTRTRSRATLKTAATRTRRPDR